MGLLVWVLLFYAVEVAVSMQFLYSVKPKTTVSYGANAQMIFFSNFSDSRFGFVSFVMRVEGETIVTGGRDAIAPDRSTKVFGNRLSAIKYPNTNEYRLFISEARYEDNLVIDIMTLITEGSAPDIIIVRSNTTLEVLGGPGFCQDSITGPPIGKLPSTTDVQVNTSQVTYIETRICGNPMPRTTWTFEDKILTDATSELVVKDPAQGSMYKGRYRFRVRLPMVTPSMCGKRLKFSSLGYNGVIKNGETILNIKFTPSTVIKTSYRINSSCVHVEWEPIEIGLCSGLQYEIRFSNKTGFPIATSIFPHPDTSHEICFGDVTSEKSTQVQAQAHFDGVAGGWSKSDFVLMENPSKPTIKTDTSTQGDGVHEDWEAIVGGVVGGFLIILLIILIIYCCCCGCWAGMCGNICVCCEKEKKEKKYGVENSNSLSYQHKKKSKKKPRNVKVDLKTDTYDNSTGNNTFAPVVLADDKPYTVQSDGDKPPATIYAHVQKPSPVSSKNEVPPNMKYFDPNEFDVESEEPPTTLRSTYTNSTYEYDEGEDIDNKPSFLI